MRIPAISRRIHLIALKSSCMQAILLHIVIGEYFLTLQGSSKMAKCELVVWRPWNAARRWWNANSSLQEPWNATKRWRNANAARTLKSRTWCTWPLQLFCEPAFLALHYLRPPCTPSFIKFENASRTINTFNAFLTFLKFLLSTCIHAGNPRVPPRVLVSGPKPCGSNKSMNVRWWQNIRLCSVALPASWNYACSAFFGSVVFSQIYSLKAILSILNLKKCGLTSCVNLLWPK